MKNKIKKKHKSPLIKILAGFLALPLVFLTSSAGFVSAAENNSIPSLPSDLSKLPDIRAYAKLINIRSFLGKPVKIPVTSENPDKSPGGDQDYVYVYPPQFYKNKKTGKLVSLPVKTIYFASGKKISSVKQKEVQDSLEQYINYCFCNQDKVLEDLKSALLSKTKAKPQGYLDSFFSFFNIAQAENTNSSEISIDEVSELLDSLGTEVDTEVDDTITDEDIQTLLDSDDPKMKQMLMLLLLNLLLSQKMAEASNVDKDTCLDNGGEWVDEECTYPDEEEEEEDDDSDKETVCEDSEGTWKSFSTSKSLCLSRCGTNESKCSGSSLTEFEEAEGIIISTDDNENDNASIKGCKCPEGKCGDTEGGCSDNEETKDDDEDGVPDVQDVCKGSAEGEGVNKNLGTATTGCSCTQLQLNGTYTPQANCPAPGCNGPYYTSYTSQPGTCSNGVATSAQCIADNSGASNPTMAQQCYEQDQQKQADKKAQDQQNQQALQDLLKKLMGGDQKGGQQGGGGSQGGGGCGQGQPSSDSPGSPGSPSPGAPSTTTPSAASVPNKPDAFNPNEWPAGSTPQAPNNPDTFNPDEWPDSPSNPENMPDPRGTDSSASTPQVQNPQTPTQSAGAGDATAGIPDSSLTPNDAAWEQAEMDMRQADFDLWSENTDMSQFDTTDQYTGLTEGDSYWDQFNTTDQYSGLTSDTNPVPEGTVSPTGTGSADGLPSNPADSGGYGMGSDGSGAGQFGDMLSSDGSSSFIEQMMEGAQALEDALNAVDDAPEPEGDPAENPAEGGAGETEDFSSAGSDH